MRKLKCFQIGGQNVQEVLDEFNERRKEFGISFSSPPQACRSSAVRDGVPSVRFSFGSTEL
jgi:hypothetical protein